MDLENGARQTYIQLLTDVLDKKKEALERLLRLTQQQEEMILSDTFEEELFLQSIQLKEEKLEDVSRLDTGFEQLYESVKEELVGNKDKYITEITFLKEQITLITDLSVKIQALEKRNKTKLEALFAKKRRDIKNSRISSQTATNYYKTMAKQHEAGPYFYDKKN